jgi:hypothetical protein
MYYFLHFTFVHPFLLFCCGHILDWRVRLIGNRYFLRGKSACQKFKYRYIPFTNNSAFAVATVICYDENERPELVFSTKRKHFFG